MDTFGQMVKENHLGKNLTVPKPTELNTRLTFQKGTTSSLSMVNWLAKPSKTTRSSRLASSFSLMKVIRVDHLHVS
jgi:hypothetical protein